jgi:hypothetical protein
MAAGHTMDAAGWLGKQLQESSPDLLRELVATFVVQSHGVSSLRVSGSVAGGQDRADSDVDLLADLAPILGLLGLGRVQAQPGGSPNPPDHIPKAASTSQRGNGAAVIFVITNQQSFSAVSSQSSANRQSRREQLRAA